VKWRVKFWGVWVFVWVMFHLKKFAISRIFSGFSSFRYS